MPVNPCSDNDKPGYKWGDAGKCYIYNPNSESSKKEARKKAVAQGIAIGDIDISRLNSFDDNMKGIEKSLTQWFKEKWVDLSRPKAGGGFEPCGRPDADSGKYPKCVPAARAARMTPQEIESAIRRKRRAESTQTRTDKKPINVPTQMKKESMNVPTNPDLYARVKAEAKRRFDVYPSVYANAWLVREYKKRGGKYKVVNKVEALIEKQEGNLVEEEAMLAMALVEIAERYGKFNEDGSGIWAGYEPAEENDDKEIGVKCANCVLYLGNGICKIIEQQVEEEGKCRFAVIPDGLVQGYEEDEEDEGEEDEDMEMSETELNDRQEAQYEYYEDLVVEFGKFSQDSGENGAHYAPAAENPFKESGLICANCVFYEGGGGCEIVLGQIEPNAICKLWIIPENLLNKEI